jgi:two-component system sensor histidine kinase EvgS
VLLTDLQMPRRDGYALARALRKDGATLHIIAMTANAMPEVEERCVASGMDRLVTKPVRLDALREALVTVAEEDTVWNLEALREDFGSLALLPAMVSRFAAATQDDLADATRLRSADEAAAWSHRISGGLSVFGPSRMATMLERFERQLRGDDADAALDRLPSVVAALQAHVAKLSQGAQELVED